MIRYGISGLPPEGGDDAVFLDQIVARGHQAYELAFVHGFPWKERRCRDFGVLAAERGVALSVHAPYFAVLTVEDDEKRVQTLAAVEHTMKLGRVLGAHTVVAHTGHVKDRNPDELHALVAEGLERIEPKVRHLGVALGLETTGTDRAFGSLGDIALIASRFSFVRPVIDWAHVHAKSGGALTSEEAFRSVIDFLREEFPGWAIDPLHAQFTDNEVGGAGEIRHVPYGEGTLRSGPLAVAATEAGLRMIVISEAKDDASHDAILADLRSGEASARPVVSGDARPVGSRRVHMPDELFVEPDGEAFFTIDQHRRVRLSNVDKDFFPDDGYTKGDLIQYYTAVAPLLLPHLAGRAMSLARYPNGATGDFFYEKQCPAHAPEWLVTAPLHSSHRGEPISFCTAPDVESLEWIANLGCIEMHPWLSRVSRPAYPDFAVFDLDPQEGATWQQVVYVAGLVRVLLERLGLAAYPKTSGASGLHIYVPLEATHEYEEVRRFVETLGRMIESVDPDTVTMQWDIPKRGPRVFIDHNQNVGGKTMASVYSVRPRPGAPVSAPITWDEVDSVHPDDFTIATVWDRFRQYGDLFAPVLRGGQTLEGASRALGL
jgi:bifunctional non-homologous end joining protein LigD